MVEIQGQKSPTGVFVADDFRDHLIIDRYDPCLAMMRASKIKHLRSENSEDAVTWNVFRSLRQMSPMAWLPLLTERAFPEAQFPQTSAQVSIELWKQVGEPILRLNAIGLGPKANIPLKVPSQPKVADGKGPATVSARSREGSRVSRHQALWKGDTNGMA